MRVTIRRLSCHLGCTQPQKSSSLRRPNQKLKHAILQNPVCRAPDQSTHFGTQRVQLFVCNSILPGTVAGGSWLTWLLTGIAGERELCDELVCDLVLGGALFGLHLLADLHAEMAQPLAAGPAADARQSPRALVATAVACLTSATTPLAEC